jgi:hypothetical protein
VYSGNINKAVRRFHAPFEAKMAEKAHGICAEGITSGLKAAFKAAPSD